MSDERQRRPHTEELSHLWDALTTGQQPPESPALDPEETAFVAYLAAQARRAQTPAGAQARARRALLRQLANQRNGGRTMNGSIGIAAPLGPFAPALPGPRGGTRRPSRAIARPARWVTFYTGSALLLVVLGLLLYSFNQSTRPAVAPGTQDSLTALP